MNHDYFFTQLKRLDALHGLALRRPWLTRPLRLLSYLVYRLLELILGQRHPHVRVVAQAERMTDGARSQGDGVGNHKVLFFTFQGWFAHVGTEAVLAKALQRRGAQVSFFLCGGVLPQCDYKPGSDAFVTAPLCWRCMGFARRLLDAFELPHSCINDWISPQGRTLARRLIAMKSRGELEDWEYKGLDMYSIVRPSVQRSLLRGDVGGDELSERVLRGFLESAVVVADVIDALLDHKRPEVVVMTNGLFFAEAILLGRARLRGIEAITYERGIPVGSVLFDRNRPAIRFDVGEAWPLVRDRPLNETQNQRLDQYLESRAQGHSGVIELWPRMQHDRDVLVRRMHLDPEVPLAVLFTNVLWDSAVYGRDIAFDGMFDWVHEVIETFGQTPERQLVVRVHPAEVRIPLSTSRDRVSDRIGRRFPKLPPNVRQIAAEDPASSYTLIELADAVLVYTSTIGLEAAVRGRPVVVAGQTHYGNRGFTVDVSTRGELRAHVAEAMARRRLAADKVALARRYAYLFFLEFMQPFPWIVDTPRADRTFTFSQLQDLDPGRDARLDRLCRAILKGDSFCVPSRSESSG